MTLTLVAAPAFAHFLLLYTPQVNLAKATDAPFRLIFWHPMQNGAVMDLEQPQAFYYVHRNKQVDLLATLKPFTYSGAHNAATGWQTNIPLRRTGDYVFVVVPQLYFEASEQAYIQQITKSYVNRSGIPGEWSKPLDLATEIVPLNRPTNVLAGSTFTGRVLSNGKPVAGAELEIEFMAAEPDLGANQPKPAQNLKTVGGALSARTNASGYFTFGIPRAGFWGFAALGTGPKKSH
ncbi:MAG: DUF4198 domain-containing protein, partial [Chromatiales bacterium]|nr:DUF4198 domain-containing protein [Chromatiales bacterium]